MSIKTYRNDPRFADCPNAFLVTGMRNNAALDRQNRRLLAQKKTGYWKVAQGRISIGDAIFLLLPDQTVRHGYPRELFGGVITKVASHHSGGVEIKVQAFHQLGPIDKGITHFLQGPPPTGSTALAIWTEDDEPVAKIDQDYLEDDEAEEKIRARKDIGSTQITRLIQARRGQGIFRLRVQRIEKRCRITGIDDPTHLRASHIKAWRFSSDEEKLSDYNGLMLAPHVDHLFDKHLISFTDDGDLLVSPGLDRDVLERWAIPTALNVGKFSPEQAVFLAHHRECLTNKCRGHIDDQNPPEGVI